MSQPKLGSVVTLVLLLASVSRAHGQPSGEVTTYPRGAGAAERPPPAVPPAPPALVLGLEPRWEGRFYRHTEFTAPNVRSYDASGYPALAIAAELYPLARADLGAWRDLGITLRYAQALGLQSNSVRLGEPEKKTSLPVDTSFARYAIGLRYRFRIGPDGPQAPVLGTSAGFGGWDFGFASDLPSGPDLEAPTAHDRMFRLGFDAALQLAPVTFRGEVTYLHAFSIEAPSSREVDDLHYVHLPTAVGEGCELRLGTSFPVWRSLEIRFSIEYALLVFQLRPLEGRADDPARVVDSYVSFGLGPYVGF